MAGNREDGGRFWNGWRITAWSGAALLLMLPLVAMQFTGEVRWDGTDFALAGSLIVGAGLAYEAAASMTQSIAYRAAFGLALATAFLLVWMNLAVGLIGSEDNPANLLYGAVLAICVIGALAARFKPSGMARAMTAAALAQALVGVIAIFIAGNDPESSPIEIVGVTALFVAPWLISAWLFHRTARTQIRVEKC